MCQKGALAALRGPQDCVEAFRKIYERRRKTVLDRLDRMGIAEALEEAGVQPGDTVRIGDNELLWEE